MASLAGVPPFLGFWAKLAVLRAALEGGMLWLALVGVVFAVIGAFYYLRVIKAMYFDEPTGERAARPARPPAARRVRRQCAGAAGAGLRVEPDHGVVPARIRAFDRQLQRIRRPDMLQLGLAKIVRRR